MEAFFKELHPERKIYQQRLKWLERIELDKKEERLFELEVWLKGLDRFFNISNLPLNSDENPIRINFVDELAIAGSGYSRVIELSRRFLEANEKSYYQFRYYVESELLGDLARSRVVEESLIQRTPEESLMLIYASFLSLRNLARELVKLKEVRYPLFFHLGSLTTRSIVQNKFFNPIRGIFFRPEYDQVANRVVKKAVKGIMEGDLRKMASLIILAFYRLRHYLEFVHPELDDIDQLKSSLIIFALINSEARHLVNYLENEFRRRMEQSREKIAREFAELADALGFQLTMELKKINHSELAGISKETQIDRIKTGVENSKGILDNFLEQSIVQMIQALLPQIQGEEIFPNFISKKMQSIKLREDLAVFHSLMDKFEEITETSIEGASVDTFKKYLFLQKAYIEYLEANTVPLIRYGDLVEFRRYFQKIKSLSIKDLNQKDKLEHFKMESKFFKIFLETTLGQINQRAELQGNPLDEKKVQERLKEFIAQKLKESEREKWIGKS